MATSRSDSNIIEKDDNSDNVKLENISENENISFFKIKEQDNSSRVFKNNNTANMNCSADFWKKDIGVNVYTANTKKKEIIERWSEGQDKPISDEIHEFRKKNGLYNNGIAIRLGKIFCGTYKDKYLVAIDLDNKKAIEEFCGNGLEELKQQTLVEQHADPNKMHI